MRPTSCWKFRKKTACCKPGRWSSIWELRPAAGLQVAAELVGPQGDVIGFDILPIDPLPGVTFIQGDFREDEALRGLRRVLDGRQVDLVISDMAPNVSGVAAVDQPRAMHLCELALDFCEDHLRPGGGFVCKVFHGEGFDPWMRDVKAHFGRAVTRKPKASTGQ